MSPESFCYWLQGFVELCPNQQPSEAQWRAIKDHLSLVFKKQTPTLDDYLTKPVESPLKDAIGRRWQNPYTLPLPYSLQPTITC